MEIIGIILIVIFVFFILVLVAGVTIYNNLVGQREQVNEGWSSIDVQLKRRFNLVKNLVNVVKGYAEHEAKTLQSVTDARAESYSNKVDERAESEKKISKALVNMLSVAENYPDLKADGNFLALQEELMEIEDAIQKSRRYYNGVVRKYNTLTQTFPPVIIANMFAFQRAAFFELEDETHRQLAEVDFG